MAAQDTLVGHTLAGRYTIERFVGEEALGKVYLARRSPQQDRVTVKVLHPHLVDSAEVVGRFGREMLATAAVEHPNTVRMLDFGEHRGIFHFLVLEHIEAEPLDEVIAREAPLSVERVAHIAAQICSALAAAHAESIIHRNLRSSNALLLRNAIQGDYVKIRDFGLSRLQGADGDETLTAVGARVGTADYMPPEYVSDGTVDPRGDLYALGVLMFEMLTGRRPFVGRAGEVMEAHVSEQPPAPSTIKRGIPDWMEQLVLQLLAKQPAQRPRDGNEVIRALQQGTGKRLEAPALRPLHDSMPAIPSPAEEAGASAGRKAGMAVGAIVGGVLILAAFAVVVGVAALFLGGAFG